MAKLLNVNQFTGYQKETTYLVLINPERIPHLVFLQNGRFYSLTYLGTDLNRDFLPYFKRLQKGKNKMIFIALRHEASEQLTSDIFKRYKSAGDNQFTCFSPVKDILLPNSRAEMIFELIPDLYENQKIVSVSQIGLDESVDKQGDFELSEYNKEDIFSYIQALKTKHAKRKKSHAQSS
ncbi:MAG: hypothetical protein WDZ35_07145 [Crocinitomicaceae bacterium]